MMNVNRKHGKKSNGDTLQIGHPLFEEITISHFKNEVVVSSLKQITNRPDDSGSIAKGIKN